MRWRIAKCTNNNPHSSCCTRSGVLLHNTVLLARRRVLVADIHLERMRSRLSLLSGSRFSRQARILSPRWGALPGVKGGDGNRRRPGARRRSLPPVRPHTRLFDEALPPGLGLAPLARGAFRRPRVGARARHARTAERRALTPAAQRMFRAHVEAPVLAAPGLYAGKPAAALDRQRPRDLPARRAGCASGASAAGAHQHDLQSALSDDGVSGSSPRPRLWRAQGIVSGGRTASGAGPGRRFLHRAQGWSTFAG